MLKKITISGILFFSTMVFLITSKSEAQNTLPPIGDPSPAPAVQSSLVASVSIYDAKITSQNQNTFYISFDLSNGKGIQPDVKYGVQLIKHDSKSGDVIADDYVYPEKLNLGENSLIHKEIVYKAPALNGNYSLWMTSRTGNGLLLGLAYIKDITLTSNSGSIELLADTCFLSVKEDEEKTKYTLNQGVDISSEETLIGTCAIKNHFQNSVTLIPNFETFHRSVFGKRVDQAETATTSITLKAGERKEFSFVIPKASEPQAYDVRLNLINSEQKIGSNSVIFHYIIQGANATIQNFTLDKDYYERGEFAKVMVFWTESSDGFLGARAATSSAIEAPKFNIEIKNTEGMLCGALQNISQSGNVENLSVEIIKDCLSPQVSIALSSKSTTSGDPVVVMADFDIQTSEIPQTQKLFNGGIKILTYVISLIVLILVASIILWLRTLRKKAVTQDILNKPSNSENL